MEELVVGTDILLILLLIAVAASFVDTLAGGGGLIVLPALILSGLPPLQALGTNKLQGTMGTATATIMMLSHRRIHWHEIRWLMCYALTGAALGTVLVQFIDTELLGFVIPFVLAGIAGYFLLSSWLVRLSRNLQLSTNSYSRILVPVIGFYDGMFGPGTGSFFALAGVATQGQDLHTATARAKPLNFATNIASLTIFILAGQVFWKVGLVMMLGQMTGAWLGSHSLFRIKVEYLRYLIVAVCLGMLLRYLLG